MMMPVNWKVRQLLGQGGSPGTELIESWCAGITGPTCQGESVSQLHRKEERTVCNQGILRRTSWDFYAHPNLMKNYCNQKRQDPCGFGSSRMKVWNTHQ